MAMQGAGQCPPPADTKESMQMSDPYVPPDSNESSFADERPVTTEKSVAEGTAAESRTEPVPVRFATSPPAPRIVIENEGPNVLQPGEEESVEGYVGVDPAYQNFASVQNQPFKADEVDDEPEPEPEPVNVGPARGNTGGPGTTEKKGK